MKLFRTLLAPLILCALSVDPAAAAQDFVHPGGLHTKEDLIRMRTKVTAGEHPWIDGWNALLRDRKAQDDYKPAPHPHMISRQRAQDDATAAYLNALRWCVSGEKSNAECAVRILNGWSETVNEVAHGPDQPGLGGIPIGSFALAAEVLRTYPGWSAADQKRFKRMLTEYFYPACHDFLTRHNGASDNSYWANWDTCNMLAILAIGVYCDDRAKFDEAVEYFKNGRGTGAIRNAVPFVFPDGLGQWQESGRDQAHVMGGMGLMVEMCQVAWNQGLDLFGYDHNRLLAGAEYTAQYTLWKGVPYTFYTNSNHANQYYVSPNYHGRLLASHFELVYNHYVVRKGLKAPHVKLFAELRRPEPGEADIFGYGTLTFTLDAKASPLPVAPPVPREVAATGGLERVELKWSPSGAYTAHGYEVCRATSETGPYESIYSTSNWTTPAFTDTKVEPGRTYYYTIAALNNAGKSAPSAPVSAVAEKGGPLPEAGDPVSVEGVSFAKAAGGSFQVPAAGRELDGNFVGLPYEGDFNLTARLVEWKGSVGMMGVAVRESDANDPSNTLAMTLGEIGGRQARFRIRTKGNKSETKLGCDYTWLPVWLRLQRVGDTFTAFQSVDGIEWFAVGDSKVTLPAKLVAGLLVSGGGTPPGADSKAAPLGIFDHVTLEQKPPLPPAAPGSLKATQLPDNVVRLDWTNATNSNQAGTKVEASIDGAPFYEIADLSPGATRFENTGIKDPGSIRYRLRAYNRGGYSAYSDVVP